MDSVSESLAKSLPRNRNHTPPRSTYCSLSYPRHAGSAEAISFLEEDLVTNSVNEMALCWAVSLQSYSLRWRFENIQKITCMEKLGSNLLVVGSDCGYLTLVDWTQCTKQRTFSFEQRPQQWGCWLPHHPPGMPIGNFMGIIKFHVESSFRPRCTPDHWGRYRIRWITKCGWVLSTEIESYNRCGQRELKMGECRVLHSSPPVEFRDTQGRPIDMGSPHHSLPREPIAADASTVLCWTDVPSVTKVLPHHDKYVLDSQPQIIRSETRALLWKEISSDDSPTTIPLSKGFKSLPQVLMVHPSREWIVAAFDDNLGIVCARK